MARGEQKTAEKRQGGVGIESKIVNMKNMIPLFTLLLIGLSVWYMAQRTAYIFSTSPRWWYVAYTLAFVMSVFGLVAEAKAWSDNFVMHLVVIAGSVLIGILLYLLVIMLVADVLNRIIKMPHGIYGILVGASTAALCIYAIIQAFTPQVKEVKIALSSTPPVRIVQLTDVHLGHFRGKKHVEKLVHIVNRQHPDIVVFTGDCFESWYNFTTSTLEPFRKLEAPVYFVSGNHDAYVNAEEVKDKLRATGVQVLENEVVETNGISLVGLDYMNASPLASDGMHAATNQLTISEVIPVLIQDTLPHPIIVMHHTPLGAQYIAEAGADLFLAGHTHGGQLWPMTWINNRAFEFNKGLKKFDKMQVYVSCGSGTFGPPMRLGTHSEITVIDLVEK